MELARQWRPHFCYLIPALSVVDHNMAFLHLPSRSSVRKLCKINKKIWGYIHTNCNFFNMYCSVALRSSIKFFSHQKLHTSMEQYTFVHNHLTSMIIPVKQIPHWAEISVWMQFDLVGILNQFLSSLQEATAQILVHSVVFEKALPPKKRDWFIEIASGFCFIQQ